MTKFEKFQRIIVLALVAVSFFYGGYYIGKRGYIFEVRRNPPKITIINQFPGDKKVDFNLFWQVWDMINNDYLERPVDTQKMLYGAISGMVNSLGDPYTSFLAPQTYKIISNAINGKYEGIGAELGFKEKQLVVVSPLNGSPAKAAGVMAGDKILEIEGVSTIGMNLNDAVVKIRGEAGTISTLKLQRDASDPFVVRITRGEIKTASVTWEDKGNGVAYIRINRFGGDTNDEWTKTVSEVDIKMKELNSIVLDVRGNPGGYLQSAVFIANEFFRNKPVLYEEKATGEQVPFMADRVGNFINIPAVFVLIDGGSASASEILAAALRDNIHAKLIGEKSFGKGTVQDDKSFADGSGIHVTIAKWLTPNKDWIHKIGLEPDIMVSFTPDDAKNNKDPQLEKAVELAKKI